MMQELLKARGEFLVVCRDERGRPVWKDRFSNLVVNVGKNLLLTEALAGASYTVTGPYMGLINSSGSTYAATDTMTSHAGWAEAGNANAPTYSGTRNTCVWAAASGGSIALSASLVFNMTGTGTLGGAFIVFGSGASATIDNTSGTLFSAGSFTGGTQAVQSGYTVSVGYSLSV